MCVAKSVSTQMVNFDCDTRANNMTDAANIKEAGPNMSSNSSVLKRILTIVFPPTKKIYLHVSLLPHDKLVTTVRYILKRLTF